MFRDFLNSGIWIGTRLHSGKTASLINITYESTKANEAVSILVAQRVGKNTE
jgi:hypothetical protein